MRAIENDIDDAVAALAQDFGAAEIWLFGSAAAGLNDEHSDIDLLVVRERRPDCPRPSVEARLCLSRCGVHQSFDLLVLTPEQWRAAKHQPFGVYDEVLRRGRKLYER